MKTYTRYNNPVLFERCQQLCPFPIIKGEGFNHWTHAADYLEWIIEHGDDVAMNIDIDCFITDQSVLQALITDFKAGEYTHAGISDGGCLSGRNNISWAVMNPFFNLFASDWIKQSLPLSFREVEEVREYGFRPEMNKLKPDFIPDYERSMWEPFNGFFNWLMVHGKPMWLHGDLHSDGISTVIKYQGKPFAIHTWYSREYNHNAEQKARIDARYKEALGK